LIYLIAFGYLSYNDHKMAMQESENLTDAYSEKFANDIMIKLNSDMSIARTLTQSYEDYEKIFSSGMQNLFVDMLKNVLINNQQFYNAALNWEISSIDKNYKKTFGRVRYIYYRAEGRIIKRIDTLETDGDIIGSPYYDMKINPREDLSEPYLFSSSGKNDDLALVSSISIPIMDDKKYIGLLQFDVNLERFQYMINQVRPFKNSYGFLVSNSGTYIANHNAKLINQKIGEVDALENVENKILDKINNGNHFSYIKKDSTGVDYYVSMYPLKIGKSKSYWSFGIAVPIDVMSKKANVNVLYSIIVAIIGFLILIIVIWYISKSISKPLNYTSDIIKEMAKGNISSNIKIKVKGNDEISDIHNSLNKLIDGLESNLKFALQIGKGNLDYESKLLTEEDALGKALLEMRKSLKIAAQEEQKRKFEDQKLNWATNGAAKFAEIMRENTDKLSEFSYNVISNLVKYLNANQGGLFIINDNNKDDVIVELSASYAYDRRKYIDKKIKLGVGLVGRCIKEAETIYMTDFPEDYINLSSGLGESKPKSLLLVPIIFNQQVFGVVEMASIGEFEKYQIDFVERIGESIGSTILNVKMNERTARLLEESNLKSEELVGQEEEMRQNLEEMKATQEELEIKAAEFKSMKNALNKVALVAEFDMQGRLLDINKNFLRVLNKTREEMIGTFQGVFTIHEDESSELFRNFWNDLRQGNSRKSIQHVKINNRDVWISESYSPMFDKSGEPFKVLNISFDITKTMKEQMKK
ncbi:MAG: GAF domain-containing protein, partial [Bacteroidales bacterium]|nr:GAF domain-containing protein [Bacteroidales bacterium]